MLRKTKIVCTLGPSTDQEGVMRNMIVSGMNVARFNFSHGSHEEHAARLAKLRALRDELCMPVAALLDTKGPEIRLKNFKNGKVTLKAGQTFTLTTRDVEGDENICSITYKELRELAYMGASVLHEDAIFPVRREGIPINIRNTNKPEDPGTLIVENTCRKPKYTITGIAGKTGFCSVTIEKAMMNSEIGFGRKVLGVFEDCGISFEHMPSGIDTMTIYVHQDEFEEKEQQVIAGIHRAAQYSRIPSSLSPI